MLPSVTVPSQYFYDHKGYVFECPPCPFPPSSLYLPPVECKPPLGINSEMPPVRSNSSPSPDESEVPMPQGDCRICGAPSTHAHFGVLACRACAAFFRRTVALGRRYTCRHENRCPVFAHVRCMCRACRFQKCIDMGMQVSGVQKFRDANGKRDSKKAADGSPADGSPLSPETSPSLSRLQSAYERLRSVRRTVYNDSASFRFTNQRPEPRCMTYQELNKMQGVEMSLVADFVMGCFDECQQLPAEQMHNLYQHFFIHFSMLESGYLTYMSGQTAVIYKQNGNFIDLNNPSTFYFDQDGSQKLTPDDMLRLTSPIHPILIRNIVMPMIDLQMDEVEFLMLSALVLWSSGIDGETLDTEEVAGRVRARIMTETLDYFRHTKQLDNEAMRLSQIVLIIPALQRIVRRVQENIEISRVFNVYTPDPKVYELVNSKF